MNLPTQILLIFFAGGLGTLSRFGLASLLSRFFPQSEPWGTMLINIIGCLCFGIIAEAFQIRAHWSLQTRIIMGVASILRRSFVKLGKSHPRKT